MATGSWAHYTLEQRNSRFLQMEQFWDKKIQDRKIKRRVIWDMIPRGVFPDGEGLNREVMIFHPGKAEQRGLQLFRSVQVSSPAIGAEPGIDACDPQPQLLSYGFGRTATTGLRTDRASPNICIKDIKYTWQFGQQLGLIFNYLMDYQLEVMDNYHQETMLRFANDAGRFYVLTDGRYTSLTGTYDPKTPDADGDNILTVTNGSVKVSTINWTHMQQLNRYLEDECPDGSIGQQPNGRMLYAASIDLEDFEKYVDGNAALREDYRYAKPEVNIQGMGTVETFRGWALRHNRKIPRFDVKTNNGTTVVYKRVDPFIEEATQTGTRWVANPDYDGAEFGTMIPMMTNIFSDKIPPDGPTNPGGGTEFGSVPLDGTFSWKNIQDPVLNINREKGFYYSQLEVFAYPELYHDRASALLYRRCPSSAAQDCDLGTNAGNSPVNAVAVAGAYATAVSGSTTKFTIKTDKVPNIQPIKQVTIRVDNSTDYTAYLVGTSGGTTQTYAVALAATATSVIAAGSSIVISWS